MGTISANGEREIGELIAKAMEKVGKEGVITIQVSLVELPLFSYLWICFLILVLFLGSIGLILSTKYCRMGRHYLMSWKLLRG